MYLVSMIRILFRILMTKAVSLIVHVLSICALNSHDESLAAASGSAVDSCSLDSCSLVMRLNVICIDLQASRRAGELETELNDKASIEAEISNENLDLKMKMTQLSESYREKLHKYISDVSHLSTTVTAGSGNDSMICEECPCIGFMRSSSRVYADFCWWILHQNSSDDECFSMNVTPFP